MGLFDKKICGVCGDKIGLFGNRKLEDGNLCGNCAKKLSPLFNDRRTSTVDSIKQQLAYREANKQEISRFNVSRQFGESDKVLVDDSARKFIVTSAENWQSENPDIIAFSQVTNFQLDIEETKEEIMDRDSEDNAVSFNPPRYECFYNFNITINVNSPYFNEITLRLNDGDVKDSDSDDYKNFERQARELQEALK